MKSIVRASLFFCAPLAGCVAMSAPTASTESPLYGELEKDVNRLGSDFRDFDLDQDDPELCKTACDEDAKCKPGLARTEGALLAQGPGAAPAQRRAVLRLGREAGVKSATHP